MTDKTRANRIALALNGQIQRGRFTLRLVSGGLAELEDGTARIELLNESSSVLGTGTVKQFAEHYLSMCGCLTCSTLREIIE